MTCSPTYLLLRLVFAIFSIAINIGAANANGQTFTPFGSGGPVGLGGITGAGGKTTNTVTTPNVRAELMAYAPQGVQPGQPLWLGLQIKHQPQWHTYWKNAGDSGLPTELNWTLPEGLTAGDTLWPVPHKIRIGTLVNYGYEGTVLLVAPAAVSPGFGQRLAAAGVRDVEIKLHATWLVCRTECIPEQGDFVINLPTQASTAMHAAAFAAAAAAAPRPLTGSNSTAVVNGQRLQVSVGGLPASMQGQMLDFFPETTDIIDTSAELGTGWTQQWQGQRWTASIALSAQRSTSPDTLPVVLALAKLASGASSANQSGLVLNSGAAPLASTSELSPPPSPTGWATIVRVQGGWPAPPAGAKAPVSAALQDALQANTADFAGTGASVADSADTARTTTPPLTLWAALLGALLGGMILNLMPCVFPVLAIKLVGFASHAQDRRAHRTSGIAYTAGVMLSFLALGGVMLALRAAGAQLGWGFQLQSPAVVAALAALFTVLGLNLVGVFEFGKMLPSRLAAAQARNPVVNALLSGVLAVAVASPCTAPFMGASLGLAMGLPALQALLVFATMGLGMALPYLLASLVPAVARALPRPGAWMDTFRRAMAFPMFATVAWLVWVLGQQSGIDGAGALLALLVALSAVVWACTLAGHTRRLVATFFIAIFVALAAAVGKNILQTPPTAEPAAASAGMPAAGSGQLWQPWSVDHVQQRLDAGQPVFVDFTAAWCITCQYNKKTTLANPTVLAGLRSKNVALLRADWTRRDPAITAALGQLGRSGVPVYVLYSKGRPPVLLNEVLSVDEVITALAQL